MHRGNIHYFTNSFVTNKMAVCKNVQNPSNRTQKSVNCFTTKQLTKKIRLQILKKKKIKSKLYHIENSKNRGQTM